MISLILRLLNLLNGGKVLDIDPRLRIVIFKPMLKARTVDSVLDKNQSRLKSKQTEMDLYNKNKNALVEKEVNRLRSNAKNIVVVREYDCGPCTHCRVRDCDGYSCRKNRGK